MILASDALSSAGRLLLARGCEITESVAGRLDHFPRGSICEPIPEVGETEQA
jgi:hypothetical protein